MDIACGVVGTKIYLFGGYTGSPSYSIQVYDTVANTIDYVKNSSQQNVTLPNAIYGMACGVVGTKCYLFGGGTSSAAYSTIQMLDTSNNDLSTLNITLPNNSYKIGCGVISYNIYLFGGDTSNGYLNTINKLALSVPLQEDKMLLTYNTNGDFAIINEDTIKVKINPTDCYKGDSNNIGQQVKIALYDETQQDWVEIN